MTIDNNVDRSTNGNCMTPGSSASGRCQVAIGHHFTVHNPNPPFKLASMRTISVLLLLLSATNNQRSFVAAFLPLRVRPTEVVSLASNSRHLRYQLSTVARRAKDEESSDDDEYDGNIDESSSDLSWLHDAMDAPSIPDDGLLVMETQQGISGFAVDPQRGFVVVLVGGDRATYAVLSPKDKQDVRSAEALCMVQLAGGLDLGTPILPPDILARLVAEETGADVRELRREVKLLRVNVIANENQSSEEQEKDTTTPSPKDSTRERDAIIEEQAVKVAAAVKKLPGLEECTLEQVGEAMQLHANEDGQIDRQAFTELLHYLRVQINAMEPSKVQFNLVVAHEDEELTIQAPSAVIGVGLSLRYGVDVVVAEECQVEGFDVVEIASRFPAFRPIKQLEEDARIMDGFIPQMFNKATLDNDDKM